jgi:medium-chain acyl-[acyl-carrier-protein] hydrolase
MNATLVKAAIAFVFRIVAVRRHGEPLSPDLGTLVSHLGAALVAAIDRPTVFFGHSLGAILSFEVSRWLRRHNREAPKHLIVSGRRAPHLLDTDPPDSSKSDADFVARLAELKGTPKEVLNSPEILDLMLPVIRSDFALAETYTHVAEAPLTCPISAIGGSVDDESIDGRIEAWRVHTTATFAMHLVHGDHFFIHSHESELLEIIRQKLATCS